MNTLKKPYVPIFLIVLASCGSSNDSNEKSQYYKKQETQTQQLELSIEASGIIEAISSVEIKSFSHIENVKTNTMTNIKV